MMKTGTPFFQSATKKIQAVRNLYTCSRKSESSFLFVIYKGLIIWLRYNKVICMHQKARIKGIRNMELKGPLYIEIIRSDIPAIAKRKHRIPARHGSIV
jgi:hypothetical protein